MSMSKCHKINDDCLAKHVLNFTIWATAQVIQYQGRGVQNFEKCCSDHKWKPSNNSHHFVSILANMAAAFDPEHGSLLTGVGCLNHTLYNLKIDYFVNKEHVRQKKHVWPTDTVSVCIGYSRIIDF